MLKKVYFIGDCHMSRIQEHWDPNNCPIELKIWGKAGTKAYDIDLSFLYNENEFSSGTERSSRFIPDKRDTVVDFQEIKDDGLIMPWIGYTDIRQFLPKYKNADTVAKHYVDQFVSFYKNSKIRFIEPLPQFTEMLLKFEGIHPSYTYEERQQQNKEFIESLIKYSDIYGLEKPITQDDIYKAVGVEKFTTDLTPDDMPHPSDSLRPDLMNKVYDLFIEKALDTI